MDSPLGFGRFRKVGEVVIDQSRLSRSGDDLEFLEACAIKGVTVRALTGGKLRLNLLAASFKPVSCQS